VKWLDLFCGRGCVARGLVAAGHEVIGVDIKPAPNYPGRFYQMDVRDLAMNVSRIFPRPRARTFMGLQVDAIWASPPCLNHTELNTPTDGKGTHPDLIKPTRKFCIESGLPYVIENVPDAPLHAPFELCGCMFGLGVNVNGTRFHLERTRIFETNFPVAPMEHFQHDQLTPVICGIGAHARNRSAAHGGRKSADFTDFVAPRLKRHRWLLGRAFGIDDHDPITCKGITDGIPPIYAQYIATELQAHLETHPWTT